MLALWTSPRIWIAAIALVAGSGYASGILHGVAGLWLLAIALPAARLRTSHGWARAGWIAIAALFGVLLGMHVLPGFSNPLVLDRVILAHDARPYSQYINFDKTLAGALFLACSGWRPIGRQEWRQALGRAVPVLLITAIAVMTASMALGFVRLDVRWPSLFVVWAPINLLTTCLSEEAFFRELLQRETRSGFSRVLGQRQGAAIALVASAVAFGLAHAAGGWRYVVVSTVAGAGYAAVYHRTGRIELSVLAHFSVNAIHFLLFTYPALT